MLKRISKLLVLAILMGGSSLNAMDDAAQLNALEIELAKLTIKHDELEQEFEKWNKITREMKPRFQLLRLATLAIKLDELEQEFEHWNTIWQEISKVKRQKRSSEKK